MARKRRGNPVNGWVILDKPPEMTSTNAVSKVRKAFNAAKAGHGGTLDPLATGVLPIALGEATKTVPYVMDGLKKYSFRIIWGEDRATNDAEGEIIENSDIRPSEKEIKEALPIFKGHIEQTPPDYSAVKVNGKRAYELARNKKELKLASRPAYVKEFNLEKIPNPDCADFSVISGKGVYMRSLVRDLAYKLGTVGYISNLRRHFCGPFSEEMAISLDKLFEVGHIASVDNYLFPVETSLDDISALALSEETAARMRNGQTIPLSEVSADNDIEILSEGETVCTKLNGTLIAISRISNGKIKPVRVLNL